MSWIKNIYGSAWMRVIKKVIKTFTEFTDEDFDHVYYLVSMAEKELPDVSGERKFQWVKEQIVNVAKDHALNLLILLAVSYAKKRGVMK